MQDLTPSRGLNAILKAGLPELAQIVVLEAKLARLLWWAHRRAVKVAVVAALTAAKTATTPLQIAEPATKAYAGVYLVLATKLTDKHIDKLYKLGALLAYKNVTGKRVAKVIPDPESAIGISFELPDEQAIRALQRLQVLWIGEHFSRNIQEAIKTIVGETILAEGIPYKEAAKLIEEVVLRELGTADRQIAVPTGWRGTYEQYFRGIATNVTSIARATGAVATYAEFGVTEVIWVAALDERTCERCLHMHGKRFKIDDVTGLISKLQAAKTPADVKRIQPWLSEKDFVALTEGSGHVSDAESKRLAELGYGSPPLHIFCRCVLNAAPGVIG